MGVSENRGPQHSTVKRRILIIRTPKIRYPLFSESPMYHRGFSVEVHPQARAVTVGQGGGCLQDGPAKEATGLRAVSV